MAIKVGDFTIVGVESYQCAKIESGVAFLKKTTESRGRFLEMKVDLVPYFNEGQLVIPEKPKKENIIRTKINVNKLIKEATDMSVSRDLVKFASENIETIIYTLAEIAKENAESKGHKRLRPSHWYWLELAPDIGHGYWPANNEYIEEY